MYTSKLMTVGIIYVTVLIVLPLL